MKRSLRHTCISLLLASNYFAFQVELFDDEYEENHRPISTSCSIAAPSLNWESFDKDNAPPAFVVDANIQIDFLFSIRPPALREQLSNLQLQLVRDKSPPPA